MKRKICRKNIVLRGWLNIKYTAELRRGFEEEPWKKTFKKNWKSFTKKVRDNKKELEKNREGIMTLKEAMKTKGLY